jgi:serine O-acetyltransferase
MFKLFKQDVQRWVIPQQIADPCQINLWVTLKLLYNYMSLQAMLWFRFGSWCTQKRIPFVKGFVYRHIMRNFGLEISPGADIGGGLYIAHPVGCVISAKHIGENCSIISGVTIGMRNEWAFPTIGDHVFIGAGARILGGITIGNGAVIGANAVVITDVPADATFVGVPAKRIK